MVKDEEEYKRGEKKKKKRCKYLPGHILGIYLHNSYIAFLYIDYKCSTYYTFFAGRELCDFSLPSTAITLHRRLLKIDNGCEDAYVSCVCTAGRT